MTIQRTTAGNLLRTTASGLMAKECCCGGVTPSSCANQDPEVYLTVFDADYAGGNISWCGETWTQAEVQAGAQKGPVCPTAYSQTKVNGTYLSTQYFEAGNAWANVNDGGLTIARNYNAFFYAGNWYRYPIHFFTNLETIVVRGDQDRRNNKNLAGNPTRPVPWTVVTFSTGNLGIICPLGATVNLQYPPMPTAYPNVPYYNDADGGYKITAGFFGSHTTGGIQYTWSQGNGW